MLPKNKITSSYIIDAIYNGRDDILTTIRDEYEIYLNEYLDEVAMTMEITGQTVKSELLKQHIQDQRKLEIYIKTGASCS
jgi:hypothetical protein